MSDDQRPWPPKLARPHTLLGMLQHGTGAGFLRALSAPRARAHTALMRCITVDPRVDHQVEARSEYYGELAIAIELPPAEIDAWVRANDYEPDPNNRAYLAISTLGAMRQRGSAAARAVLRAYLANGNGWDHALFYLVDDPSDDIEELAGILDRRFKGADGLKAALADTSWSGQDALAKAPGRVGRAARELRDAHEPRKPETPPSDLADLPLGDLMLRAVDHVSEVAVGKELARRALPLETLRPWLALRAVRSEFTEEDGKVNRLVRPAGGAMAAMRSLARRPEHEVFQLVLEIAVRPDQANHGNAALRLAAGRVLVTLPPDYLLPLARRWRNSRLWQQRHVAELILHGHSQPADIPYLRKLLHAPLTGRGIYRMCHALDSLARLGAHGPFPEVPHVLDYFGYSYGRRRAARVLAASDPTFPATRAFECLWDCEPGTREIGCQHVDLSLPGAVERLHALAADPVESELVRNAAAARLATRASAP